MTAGDYVILSLKMKIQKKAIEVWVRLPPWAPATIGFQSTPLPQITFRSHRIGLIGSRL